MSRVLAPLALVALLLAAWEIAVRAMGIPAYFLPPPSGVAVALAENLPSLAAAAWITLSTALIALVVASLIAVGLAVIVGLNPLLEAAVRPLASVLQVTPVVAIAPLVLIWAGIDHPERAIIALAVLVALFPIFSGAVTGLRAADPDLERLFDRFFRVDAARPDSQSHHGLGLAIVAAIARMHAGRPLAASEGGSTRVGFTLVAH